MSDADDKYELRTLLAQLAGLSREVDSVRSRLEPLVGDGIDAPTFTVRGLRPLEDVEREYIQHVLKTLDGNKSQASYLLGVDASTLHRKLARWNQSGPEAR